MPPDSGTDETDLANDDSAAYIREMDRRLIVLETRFDTILPTLATKADLIELRGEMREMSAALRADMHKWTTTTPISMFAGFGGLLFAMVKLLRPG
jgi:hypothetical protein